MTDTTQFEQDIQQEKAARGTQRSRRIDTRVQGIYRRLVEVRASDQYEYTSEFIGVDITDLDLIIKGVHEKTCGTVVCEKVSSFFPFGIFPDCIKCRFVD